MELATEPDVYAPIMNNEGEYIDKVPPLHSMKNGMYCPCGGRVNKTYNTTTSMKQHFTRTCHKQWIVQLNNNKTNYYVECNNLRQTVRNQQIIIQQMELEMMKKQRMIEFIQNELMEAKTKKEYIVCDLLNIE
jgi:hypothetical protein